MGISVRDWYKDPQGYYYGGTGMSMTLRDLARFGYLYLKAGSVGGSTVLPEAWIRESVIPRNNTSSSWGGLSSVNYGYQWWTARAGSDSLFFAAGYAGQFCFVIPQRSLIVATVADSEVTPDVASAQELFVIDLLVQYVLPVVP
jgi:CubicO group peptidase (beta-lactamase class C family)